MEHGYKIAIDMDGVLSDFARKVAEITRAIPKEKLHTIRRIDESILDKRKMWSAINFYNSHTPFFRSLDKMCDADELMEFVFQNFKHEDIMILSASGTSPKDAPEQKKEWIKHHYSEKYGDILVEVVTKSPDKAKFAHDKIILIDDRAKSIDPWEAAGGIGVLHTDTESTIKKVLEIIA